MSPNLWVNLEVDSPQSSLQMRCSPEGYLNCSLVRDPDTKVSVHKCLGYFFKLLGFTVIHYTAIDK